MNCEFYTHGEIDDRLIKPDAIQQKQDEKKNGQWEHILNGFWMDVLKEG